MILHINRITAATLILLIIPFMLWKHKWQYQLLQDSWYLKFFYWITKTISQPWIIITHIILCILFVWCMRSDFKKAIILCVVFTCTIILGQLLKLGIKNYVQELRPFVVWFKKTYYISTYKFYNLAQKANIKLIQEQILKQQKIPDFLCTYWYQENEFSFPSGHTIFASSWTLLWINFLEKELKIITFLVVWTIAVMTGRLLLGMHWPCDLIISNIISWLLIVFTNLVVQKFIIKNRYTKYLVK